MTEQQKKRLDDLIKHIRDNAESLINDTTISNDQIFAALYKRGFQYLNNRNNQVIVDIGALGLAHKIRTEK